MVLAAERGILAAMQLRPLLLSALLVAAGVLIAKSVITYDELGVVEYVIGVALIGLLLLAAFRLSHGEIRRALRARSQR